MSGLLLNRFNNTPSDLSILNQQYNLPHQSSLMSQQVSIPPSFSLFKIEPKTSESSDSNMPKSIFDAVALFHATGKPEAASRCVDCLTNVLNILAAGPDGKSEISIGHPCLCWDCGFVGIPVRVVNESEIGSDAAVNVDSLFECRQCKCSDRTNLVRGLQPDGSQIPWIEKKL